MNPPYTQDEVVANFQALIDSRDFDVELKQLGIGAFRLMQRRQMLLEFKGLFAGLWRLALARSFPVDGDQIFEKYLELRLHQSGNSKEAQRHVERARQYADMLTLRGDTDFSEVSLHLLSFLRLPDAARKSATLKLALDIRGMYNFIFQRLI